MDKQHSRSQRKKRSEKIIAGRDLKMMRLAARKTTHQMAELLGVKSRKTIENWEAESSEPQIGVFMMLCMDTGYNPGLVLDEIFKRNEADPTQTWDIDLDNCKL